MKNDKKMIEIKSLRERILLKKLLDMGKGLDHIVYTPYNGNESHDATWHQWEYTFGNAISTVIAEVKCRNYPMSSYNGWLIEKEKYDYMMLQKYDKRLFITIHIDGYQIWNLSKCTEPTWIESVLPKNNQDVENDKVKVNGDLMSSEAQKVECTNNIFEALVKAEEIWNKRNNTN